MIRARIAIVLALLALAGCAASRVDKVEFKTAEEALLALDRDWVDAEVKHDRKALDRILDDGFLATFTSGTTYDKPAYIEAVLGRPVARFEVVHELVRVHEDTAVVVDRIGPGLATKVVWIAIRREGKWRAIAEQFIAIPPAPK